jgi:hypothetical protein
MKEITRQIFVRSLGIVLMTFIPGMGIGAVAAGGDWLVGGVIATGTSFASVIIYIGVSLTWGGRLTQTDVQTAFRAAAAKAAEGNEDIQAALEDRSNR